MEIVFLPDVSCITILRDSLLSIVALRYCSTSVTISSYRATLGFSLLWPRATGYSVHLYTYTREARTRTLAYVPRRAKTEEEAEKEGHSIMLSTTWPLTVRGGMRNEVEERVFPCARSLRSDARSVRHQTSYIDHIIGRRSFLIHAIGPSI